MDYTQAKQIVSDIINFYFVNEGFPPPILFPEMLPRLKYYSLKEMIEASEIVRDHPAEEYVGEDGKNYTRHMMNLDDRLIAAMYTFFHYQSDPSDECNPIVSYKGEGLYKVK